MGLFSRKKKAPQQAQPIQPPPIQIQPWATKPVTQTYRIPAEHEARIYTYNGTVFQGLPKDTRFIVTAVPADVQMVSIYTGTASSSTDFGVAYSYNGQIFGFGSSHAEAIKQMMLGGYQVEVEAYISGYDGQQGFPKVVGLFGFVDDDVYRTVQ